MTNEGRPEDRERTDFLETLATHRGFLRYTVRDLSDEQARERTTASELCLGGLIKHVTRVEEIWARFIVEGPRAREPMSEAVRAAHEAGFRMEEGETLAGLLDGYEQAARQTDELVSSLSSLDVSQPLPEAPWFEPGAPLVGPTRAAARHRRDGPACRPRGHHPRVARRRRRRWAELPSMTRGRSPALVPDDVAHPRERGEDARVRALQVGLAGGVDVERSDCLHAR